MASSLARRQRPLSRPNPLIEGISPAHDRGGSRQISIGPDRSRYGQIGVLSMLFGSAKTLRDNSFGVQIELKPEKSGDPNRAGTRRRAEVEPKARPLAVCSKKRPLLRALSVLAAAQPVVDLECGGGAPCAHNDITRRWVNHAVAQPLSSRWVMLGGGSNHAAALGIPYASSEVWRWPRPPAAIASSA